MHTKVATVILVGLVAVTVGCREESSLGSGQNPTDPGTASSSSTASNNSSGSSNQTSGDGRMPEPPKNRPADAATPDVPPAGPQCSQWPPPSGTCAAPCPGGYKIINGRVDCICC